MFTFVVSIYNYLLINTILGRQLRAYGIKQTEYFVSYNDENDFDSIRTSGHGIFPSKDICTSCRSGSTSDTTDASNDKCTLLENISNKWIFIILWFLLMFFGNGIMLISTPYHHFIKFANV